MTTTLPPPSSAWTTDTRIGWGFRPDKNLTLIRHGSTYCLISDDCQLQKLEEKEFLAALVQADNLIPPTEWSWQRIKSTWCHKNWRVVRTNRGWVVHDQKGHAASTRHFLRADQARKWCEIRQDRVGLKLRGPKPKRVVEGTSS